MNGDSPSRGLSKGGGNRRPQIQHGALRAPRSTLNDKNQYNVDIGARNRARKRNSAHNSTHNSALVKIERFV